jgi:hypothetical protein
LRYPREYGWCAPPNSREVNKCPLPPSFPARGKEADSSSN